MASKVTVFGSSGFIGSHMAEFAQLAGYDVQRPLWKDGVPQGNLGTVIYCNGVGDCKRPLDVMYSHVGLLSEIIQKGSFEKLVYISSTRVYMNSLHTHENSDLTVTCKDQRKLFNIAKLAGENLCNFVDKDVIILRPSNVYGQAFNSSLFLPSIVRDALSKNEINMFVDRYYSKDYISVDDLVSACFQLLEKNISGTFNIASGSNVSADLISRLLSDSTGCKVNWHQSSVQEIFHPIDISKIKNAINFSPKKLEDELSLMIKTFKDNFEGMSNVY